jgi:hypothetical protein
VFRQLLKNYSRNQNLKTAITVGIVGFPNVGKSSIINSLMRTRAVGVGSTPGFTRQAQVCDASPTLPAATARTARATVPNLRPPVGLARLAVPCRGWQAASGARGDERDFCPSQWSVTASSTHFQRCQLDLLRRAHSHLSSSSCMLGGSLVHAGWFTRARAGLGLGLNLLTLFPPAHRARQRSGTESLVCSEALSTKCWDCSVAMV